MRSISLLVTILLLSGCGAIQKARFYTPINSMQALPSKEWGDGLAVADRNVCVWVGDRTALYLPMAAGPIGLPVYPLGVMAGKIDRLGYFDLGLWIVPRETFKFDPTATFLEFENGMIKQPQAVVKVPYQLLTEKYLPSQSMCRFGQHSLCVSRNRTKISDPANYVSKA